MAIITNILQPIRYGAADSGGNRIYYYKAQVCTLSTQYFDGTFDTTEEGSGAGSTA